MILALLCSALNLVLLYLELRRSLVLLYLELRRSLVLLFTWS